MLAYDDLQSIDEIAPAVQRVIAENPGKWLAITVDDVIAIGDSPAEVLRLAHDAGVTDVILQKSLEPDSLYLF